MRGQMLVSVFAVSVKAAFHHRHEAVDGCLKLTQRRAEEKAIPLVKTMAEGCLTFTADAWACKQILLNLPSNAVKFTRSGGTVEIQACPQESSMRISVRNTGIGLPADMLSRIDEVFEQACNATMLAPRGNRSGPGAGQGPGRPAWGQTRQRESRKQEGTCMTVELRRFSPDAPSAEAIPDACAFAGTMA